MGRKNKLEIDFAGFDVLKKQLDEIGGGATERAVESALKASQNIVAKSVSAAMSSHNRTGDVSESIVDSKAVEWTGDTAAVAVGFDILNGGLPSIFLMYGTQLHGQPHVKPDRNLYNAVYGTAIKKQVRKIQREAFEKVLERVMNR